MNPVSPQKFLTDKMAIAFLWLAMAYLGVGLLFGVIGSFQYLLPSFLKDQLSFSKTRPLHVYLVISWIFVAAQGGIYYYLPRIARRNIFWPQGVLLHFVMQTLISLGIILSFFMGKFGGREYLEFPPWLGICFIASWIPFAINFFKTLSPDYRQVPVYVWMWSCGIIFFFITMFESYLWLFEYFRTNIVRDITIQWKALGSMVGSWNMLVYGTGMYIMERMNPQSNVARGRLPFFFFFLGLTNLMFNWGHHTYIVPAAPWVKNVSYIISMTELLILGYIIFKWRKTFTEARKNYHLIPFRFLSFADAWIFLNLALAIVISVPAINQYTHGTHITVAHAMGATIGINSMLLFASLFFILQQLKHDAFDRKRKRIAVGIFITNISLLFFWFSLIGAGITRMNTSDSGFYYFLEKCKPFFRIFTASGVFIFLGLGLLMIIAANILLSKKSKQAPTASEIFITGKESAGVPHD
jgi:nitric oxide reductase subunit B